MENTLKHLLIEYLRVLESNGTIKWTDPYVDELEPSASKFAQEKVGRLEQRVRQVASQTVLLAETLNEIKLWIIGKYDSEVANRPDVNIYKKVLHNTWIQMVEKIEEIESKQSA